MTARVKRTRISRDRKPNVHRRPADFQEVPGEADAARDALLQGLGPGPARQDGANWSEPMVHATAGALRQAVMLQLQQRYGNSHVQRLLNPAIQRQPAPGAAPSNLDQLRTLLDRDKENEAIELMGKLSTAEVGQVLSSAQFLSLAVSAFNNNEMYRAVKAMHGDLLQSLSWMFEEGSDWDKVNDVLRTNTNGQDRVRTSTSMRNQFVSLCNNREMAEAVDRLGGDLAFKLSWMREEGSDWSLVRAKLVAAADPGQKAAVRTDGWRDFFVDVCNNVEMAEAVDLLGGDLAFKLAWMKEEGTSWNLVEPKLRATTDDAQKAVIRGGNDWKAFFVGLCNNEEMGLAVQLLGGTLEWKLTWMEAEGVNWERLVEVIAGCNDDAQKRVIRESGKWLKFFVGNCNNEEMARVVDGLGGDLQWKLTWMKEEGTSWDLVAPKLRTCTDDAQKQPIRASDDWKNFFVSLCNNREMSEAVELLGGDLSFKLRWMAAEGANWPQLREKIALCSDDAQKQAIRTSSDMKALFVETCNNDEMAEAVRLLGGDLNFKLSWMKEEGTDWPHVKATLSAVSDDAQKQPLRTDDAWKTFFVSLCNNREMAEAVDNLGGDLKFKLSWMDAEGSDWSLVKPKLIAATDPAQKQAVREDAVMKRFFVSVCGNTEMAEAVDLLGGDLIFKLSWMREEGTSWQLVREKFAACTDETQRKAVHESAEWMGFLRELCSADELREANNLLTGTAAPSLDLAAVQRGMSWDDLKVQLLLLRDDAKKAEIRNSNAWRDALVRICGNDEMAQAVDILGGDLAWKLSWMKEEGTDWQAVRAKILSTTHDAQKQAVRESATWKSFHVDICGNRDMAEAVRLLGGDLAWKLDWMLEEGTSTDLVLPIVNEAPQAEKDAVAANADLSRRLLRELGNDGLRVFEALGSAAFTAAVLIDQGGADKMIQALRVIATSANVAKTIADLRTLRKWDTFLDDCPRGSDLTTAAKPHVDTSYAALGPGMVPERKKVIRLRYHIEISDAGIDGNPPVPWTQAELDAVYQVLAQLPEGSVLNNDQIARLHLVVSGIGTYYSRYKAIHLPGGPGYNMATTTWPNAVFIENHFQGTIRHEMGHAIDALVNGEAWYMNDPNIDWDTFGRVGGWLASMEASGGWGPVSDEGERERIRTVIQNHFADPGVNTPNIAPADPNHPFNKYPACPIVQTASLNLLEGSHNDHLAMPIIGGRVFTRRPVYQEFYSYNEAARRPPVWVSNYGLSAPADWFAEQIREYFRTAPPGANTAPFVGNWFRMNLP